MRKLPQLSLRDLFWLVALVAIGCGWWIDRQRLAGEFARFKEAQFTRVGGSVRGVDAASGFVEIGLGSDDGVLDGDVVEFTRADGTKATMVVVLADYDTALARPTAIQDAAGIKQGDGITVQVSRARLRL